MYGPASAVPRRASSSITATAATMSRPAPPYSSATVRPQTPVAASRWKTSRGNIRSRSHRRTASRGISRSTKRRIESRSCTRCAGSSTKEVMVLWAHPPVNRGFRFSRKAVTAS